MSRAINTPVNQVRLTNVAVVKMQKGGKRFEIACYRNKVMDYRKGLETDLSEVLQTDRIFTNVSKGQFAKHADLLKLFGTKHEEAIATIILEKGQLQVSDLERQSQLESTVAQIATWVASHCVHPPSQRPYTVTQVRHALKGKQYQVQPHKPIKKQYLDCVKFLKTVIPIERAKMELALSYCQSSNSCTSGMVEEDAQVQQLVKQEESLSLVKQETTTDGASNITKCTLLADPSLYRVLDDLAKTLPQGKLEMLRQVVFQEGDIDLELELERKQQLLQQQQASQQNQALPQSDSAEDEEYNSSEDETAMLAKRLQQKATLSVNDKDNDDESDEDMPDKEEEQDMVAAPVSRKDQSKQKKKQSKKAKRRQKEEEAERDGRQQAEQERQQARGVTVQPVVQANAAAAAHDTKNHAMKSCNTCGGSFPTAAAYRAHFKSDWHRFNQKLKLQGMAAVSEKEFILCDAESFFGA